MRILILVALAASLALPAAATLSVDELMATPRRFVEAFDRGDIAAAAATMTADAVMIDEAPPYAWSGPDAFQRWAKDDAAAEKATQTTNERVKLGDPITTEVSGDAAYVVCASSETFKVGGVRMAETARMIFALRRENGAWKIAAWTWAARKPHPAVKSVKAP
jgi:ketosteroid isomerase-like protein